MKILILAPPYLSHSRGVSSAFQKIGYRTQLFYCNEFYLDCSYWERKLYKLGYKAAKKRYEYTQCSQLRFCYDNFQPDYILVLSGLYLDECLLSYLESLHIPKFLWTWDGINRFPFFSKIIPHFSHIFCFESKDVPFIQKTYSISSTYCPLGYDENAYFFEETIKDIDISFVGIPLPNRTTILDATAKYSQEHHLTMLIAGPWYDRKYFWKKWQYQKRHPKLFPYLLNHRISSNETANIYRRSKICLNIGAIEHLGLNPRTFEILATGSFQLTDHIYKKDIDDGILRADSMISFLNEYDLIEKIKYYLSHEKLRQEIAQKGYKDAVPHTSIRSFVQSRICPEMDKF